ncbi:glycoside hydrolase family 71/99-like protein [Planctomycetota bacterium]
MACLSLVVCMSLRVQANSKHGPVGQYPSYEGLVMAGYQGWFRTPGDGSGRGWQHFGRGKGFADGQCTIDIWPDVSDYKKTYETSFKHQDGTPARVFSSLDASTTDLHFQWMRDYGVNGVFMQRFFGVARSRDKNKSGNIILQNALTASRKYNRAIGVMYDLSGLRTTGEDCSAIITDWKELVDDMKVTNQGENQTYLFHRGKPLVTIWGLGFPDRTYNIRHIGIDRLIDFLKNDPVYGGCSVMIGIPTYFRALDSDCLPDPYLHEIIKSVDIVLPWMVQRFTPLLHNEMDRYRDQIKADISWCAHQKVDYVPIVYPGFSWHNLSKEALKSVRPLGAIPRHQGRFYWDQIHTAIGAGAKMLYVAMFDEIDEGTAIMKCSNTPPRDGDTTFIDYEGMPADHYLWLTGVGAKMLRGDMPLTTTMPTR